MGYVLCMYIYIYVYTLRMSQFILNQIYIVGTLLRLIIYVQFYTERNLI